MKPKTRITLYPKDEDHLIKILKDLSMSGGAWVYIIKPYDANHETEFSQYDNPSSVPDYFIDLTRGKIGYKGNIVGFTRAAKRREQNRGVSDS